MGQLKKTVGAKRKNNAVGQGPESMGVGSIFEGRFPETDDLVLQKYDYTTKQRSACVNMDFDDGTSINPQEYFINVKDPKDRQQTSAGNVAAPVVDNFQGDDVPF